MSTITPRYKPIVQPKAFPFELLPINNYTIERSELNDKRVYYVNGDNTLPLYSITTVLSSGDNSWVDNWKAAVGEEYAKKVSNTAALIGTTIHSLCEDYLSNKDINDKIRSNVVLYHRFKRMSAILDRFSKIYCLEKSLYSKKLQIAGTVDCIGVFDGVLSVIDFKTSRKHKEIYDIPHYFVQATAYAIMFYELYNIPITNIVIIISIDGDEPLVYTQNIKQYVPLLLDYIKNFKKSLSDMENN